MLLLVNLKMLACIFTRINIPSRGCFHVLYKWCQIVQDVIYEESFFLKRNVFDFYCFYMCVCVCVCVCVCACLCCVCLCVCILPPWRPIPSARCPRHTWGLGSTILYCEYKLGAFCQVPSSPHLKMSYFTCKDENSSRKLTGEKTIWYNVLLERWHMMI